MTTTMAAAAAAAATEAAEEGPTEAPRSRKAFSLKATSYANGGFRYYSHLPPMHMFTRALWVLQGELEVRVRRKKLFFNRETEWTRVPVFLAPHRGLLFVYMTDVKGYVLRISDARKLKFEGAKNGNNYAGKAVLKFVFGELHLRFFGTQVRLWRSLLVAIHATAHTVERVAEDLMREIKALNSNMSVLTLHSAMPEQGNTSTNWMEDEKNFDFLLHHRPSFVRESEQEQIVNNILARSKSECLSPPKTPEATDKRLSAMSEGTPVRTEPPLARPHPSGDAFFFPPPPPIRSQPQKAADSTASPNSASLRTSASDVDDSPRLSVRELVARLDNSMAINSTQSFTSVAPSPADLSLEADETMKQPEEVQQEEDELMEDPLDQELGNVGFFYRTHSLSTIMSVTEGSECPPAEALYEKRMAEVGSDVDVCSLNISSRSSDESFHMTPRRSPKRSLESDRRQSIEQEFNLAVEGMRKVVNDKFPMVVPSMAVASRDSIRSFSSA